MSDELSTSSDNTEVAIRTVFVHVRAVSRLRSLSGNVFAPTGFGRVRRDTSTPPVHEAAANTRTKLPPATTTGHSRYVIMMLHYVTVRN